MAIQSKIMIRIVNNIIPLKGFIALCIWPFLFIRRENLRHFTWIEEHHEDIHAMQQQEVFVVACLIAMVLIILGCDGWSLLVLPLYYWIYLIEWLVKCITYRNYVAAYKNVAFEREAFTNQNDMVYITKRRPFAWIHYF